MSWLKVNALFIPVGAVETIDLFLNRYNASHFDRGFVNWVKNTTDLLCGANGSAAVFLKGQDKAIFMASAANKGLGEMRLKVTLY